MILLESGEWIFWGHSQNLYHLIHEDMVLLVSISVVAIVAPQTPLLWADLLIMTNRTCSVYTYQVQDLLV